MGFPMTIFKSHPLEFSVAHRHHGRQMRSGWAPRPKSLNDRLDNLNNMVIETWSVNSMKHALDECYYPQLQQIVKDYKIPISFYDPDRVAEHGFVLESSDKTGGWHGVGRELGRGVWRRTRVFC